MAAVNTRPQLNTVELEASVSEILETVKQKGDEALKNYSSAI